MKPKGIPQRRGSRYKPSMGYTGVAVDLFSTIAADRNTIEESVEVTKPTAPSETIVESVAVVVT